MKVEKLKTLKEFKTALKKQYSNSLKNASLENAFIVSYYPLFLLVSKKNDSIIYHEIELERENSYIFKSVYQNQKDFVRTIDFIMECQKTKREFFISEVNKGIISISNFYKVPISNITIPTLTDVQKNMRFLNSFESKENDMNDLKKIVSISKFFESESIEKAMILFGESYIFESDGFIMSSICKNETGLIDAWLVDSFENDWNQTEIRKQKLQFHTESITSQFLFEIEIKELKTIIKQAVTVISKEYRVITFKNGVFKSSNDYKYEFEYNFNDSKGFFTININALENFVKQNKDKTCCFYQNKNHVLIVSENKNTMVVDFGSIENEEIA